MRTMLLSTLGALFLMSASASAVTMDWVIVGNPGNAADAEIMNDQTTGYGAVPYVYQIAKYEVTNAQYAEFLNAVADTDTNGLYSPNMAPGGFFTFGGITQSCSPGCSYSVSSGRENMPVNHVSFYDTLRFANWMHNGQPSGAQDNTTTEDGAYTITAQGISGNSITRNAGATIFLTSEDEWYKAAYYDALSASYFDYPAGSNTQTTCAAPSATPNTANCNNGPVGDFTDVGSYIDSASPYGTFDQIGNIFELNEAIIGINRGVRGGDFYGDPIGGAAATRNTTSTFGEQFNIGFRVASQIPEPGTGLLIIAGLLGVAGWRRARA